MRRVSTFALVFTAGCSLIWSMDDYKGGSHSDARDGSASGDVQRDGAPSSGSSGASSSGGVSSDASTSSSSGDSSTTPTCIPEEEPNNTASEANTLVAGANCGSLSIGEDSDWFEFAITSNTVIDGTGIRSGVRATVTDVPPSATNLTWTGGGGRVTLPPGTYHVHLYPNSGGIDPTYVITLDE